MPVYSHALTDTAKLKVSTADRVYHEIRRMVASGRFAKGEVISEVRLASELEVSRTPVREAVRRLVGENVLEVTQSGLRFYTPSLDDLAEVYYMRAILEGSAARVAAANGGVILARKLRGILEEARPLLATDGHDEFARLNGEFHGAINSASGNRRIQEALGSLNGVIVRYRRLSLMFPDHLTRAFDDHRQIVELFEEGKPEAVEAMVRDHIFRAGARIVRATQRIDGGDIGSSATAATLLAIEADGSDA
jgi:DNA-binding GntR family transcriptional regulator